MSISLIPNHDELKAIEVMAKNAVDSKYFDKLGGYPGIFSICMYAREMGLPVMSSLFGGMSNIMGKISIAPQLMNAMIRKAGHKLEIDSTDVRCIIKGTRKDTGESCSVTFSVEDARKAGLCKAGGGWDKYPSDMCFARALSRLARRLFPDVIGMAYVEGEIEEDKPKKEAKKEDPAIEVETTVMEDPIFDLCKKHPQHSPEKITDYCNAMGGKKNVSAEVFAKECLKRPELFDNFFEKWLAKQNAPKPQSTAEVAQVEQL
jgi:hypothetical protein